MGARLLDSLYVSGYGTSAASGTVQFYQPGTLTPVTVYSDDVLVTVYTQPITLDANGKTPLPVYTATPVRAIIKSVAGATLADITRFDGDRAELVQTVNASWPGATTLDGVLTLLGTSLGGTNGNFLDAGAGAVARTVQAKFAEVQISVKDYGAVGNGIADDTVAIQAAVTRIAALGGGTVFIPQGTYLISSAISVPSQNITFLGIGTAGSIIQNTNATGNAFSLTGTGVVNAFRSMRVTHSSSSTLSAVITANSVVVQLDTVALLNHITTLSLGALASLFSINSSIFATATGTAVSGGASVVLLGGALQAASGTALSTGAGVRMLGTAIQNSTVGVDLLSGGTLLATAIDASVSVTTGLRTAATSGFVRSQNCVWGTVTDQRTGAPVNYVFAGANNMTPLPQQATVIRVEQQTGAVVTTINNVAAAGFDAPFTLICSNTSAGASTFTFGANYVLSAAVTPAAGNRVALHLYYDARTSKVYEDGRGPTAN